MQKYYGIGTAQEYPHFVPEKIDFMTSKAGFEHFWDTVIHLLSQLFIRTYKEPVIQGSLTRSGIETEESKIYRLKKHMMPPGYYLMTVYAFDEDFIIRWYETKAEAVESEKWIKKNIEFLFFTYIIRIKED